MKRKIFFITIMIIVQAIQVFAQEDWKLQKDKDGTQVYSAGVPDSKIRAIKVVANYDASPDHIADIVMDINTATEWVSHLKSSYLVNVYHKMNSTITRK